MTRRYTHLGDPDDTDGLYGYPYCSRSQSKRLTRSLADVDCPHCLERWGKDKEAVRMEWPRLFRDDLTLEEMGVLQHECDYSW